MARTRTSAGIDAAELAKSAALRAICMASAAVEVKPVAVRLCAHRRIETVIEFPVTRIRVAAGHAGTQTGRRLLADRKRMARPSPQY